MRSIMFIVSLLALVMGTSADMPLVVTSSVFSNDGNIPAKYSCQGKNVNPPLAVDKMPANTKTLAIIMHDPDAPMAGGFTHWVVWDIEPKGLIAANFKGASQGMNSAHQPGYTGMCPPTGAHHYHFMVYALDTKLKLGKNTDKALLESAMIGHILAQGDLVGLYEKHK